ncbi:uncharacterized protein [Palaemon carinicauda]|uniref:uncharacterized protein n=1 Tax=Palaemon carinicauda TaxID=392227 RepID=UPI0035B59C83
MFTIDKTYQHIAWNAGDGYDHLSQALPSLLPDDLNSTSNLSHIHPGTRLAIMDGVIPYVPCQIREYSSHDVGRCCVSRKASGSRTWVAFVGDSSMRLKVHEFISLLPPELSYTYFLGDKSVTNESFIEALVHHKYRPSTFDVIGWIPPSDDSIYTKHLNTNAQNFHNSKEKITQTKNLVNSMNFKDSIHTTVSVDINDEVKREKSEIETGNSEIREAGMKDVEYSDTDISEDQVPSDTYQFRLSFVWAPEGSEKGHPFNRRGEKVKKIHEWIDTDAVPDIIVIGYGKWPFLLREFEDELVPFTELDYFSRPLVDVVQKLASRTLVLLWSQSRYRWFNFESKKYPPGNDLKNHWLTIMKVNQFSHSMPLIDTWLWTIFRGTGAWQWDSTLPFNLANLRECKVLNNLGFDKSSIYKGRWWACSDIHHSAYETSHIEIQMMLNYLCNGFVDSKKGYCCSH